MDLPICRTCGVQYNTTRFDPHECKICADERQYVGWDGQQWTTLAELREEGYRGILREETAGLWGIGTDPSFAIGQRALLVPGPGGAVMWDSVTYLDDETISAVAERGGIAAIAVSHPHYYSCVVEWSQAFGDVPIYLHAADRDWACRDGNVVFWEGDTLEILPGRTLINCGVHFDGGTVLHWADGAAGRGALCSGDIFQVVNDRRYVSFMYSYPNLIPESPAVIERALRLVEPFGFDVIYGAWWRRVVRADAKAALARSARRYLDRLSAPPRAAGDVIAPQ
ncbi:MAG TPA: MBL fold metallo-hydrolase [Streptosporangiaceae bacterium]